MSLTLWSSTRTSGTVAHLAVAEAALPAEIRFLSLREGEHRQPGYLAVNPKGQVPALQLPEGATITEVPAILACIHRLRPEAGLYPEEPLAFARCCERVAELHWTLPTVVAPAFAPGNIAPGAGEAVHAAMREAATERLDSLLARHDAALAGRGLHGGAAPDASDLFLFFIALCATWLGRPLDRWSHLVAHRATLSARPRIAAALAREGIA